MDPIARSKQELRTRIRADRRARTEADRIAAAHRIAAHAAGLLPVDPADVAGYVSLATEPGTEALNAAIRAAGHRLWLPRIVGDELEWVRTDEDTVLQTGPMGIREPVGEGHASLPEGASVIFVPALAVDGHHHRLGQGRGFYDRALGRMSSDRRPRCVAIVYRDEVLDEVPTHDHDVPLDGVVTD